MKNEIIERINDLYYIEKMSAIEISKILGISNSVIYRTMEKNKFPRRTISQALKGKFGEKSVRWKGRTTCQHCGSVIKSKAGSPTRTKKKQRFCSKECYANFIRETGCRRNRISKPCAHCGKLLELQPNQIKGKKHNFCSRKCLGEFYAPIATETLDKINRDPEIRAKVIKSLTLRPNNLESKVDKILHKYFPNEWRYVGDGSVIIGGLCPDFINVNGKKKIIEVFGDRYHDPDKTFMKSISWKRQEWGRKVIFSQFGFGTLVLWEFELKKLSDTEIVNKIKEFIS